MHSGMDESSPPPTKSMSCAFEGGNLDRSKVGGGKLAGSSLSERLCAVTPPGGTGSAFGSVVAGGKGRALLEAGELTPPEVFVSLGGCLWWA